MTRLRVRGLRSTRRLVPVFALAPLLWTASSSASDPQEWRLHARGLGRLLIGMTVEEATRVTDAPFSQVGPPPEPSTFCTYFSGELAGQEVRMRVIEGRIDRIEVSSPEFLTLSGIAVGDSIERVKQVYGEALSVEPHHYLGDQGVVVMILGPYGTQETGYGVAFTATPEKGVTDIWVGWYRGIRESEGCG